MAVSNPRRVVNPKSLSPPTGSPATPYYSWVVTRGNFITLAGMSPYDKDKNLIGTNLRTQTEQAFRNLKSALEAVNATMDDVCSITIHVQATDLQKDVYPHINPAGLQAFGPTPPARTVVGGVSLPRTDELVLISAIAIRENGDR